MMADLKLEDRKDLFLEILEASRFHVAETCRILEMSRTAYYTWLEEDEDFAQRVREAKEGLIDWAESKLLQNVEDRVSKDIHYFLDAQAKHRGYGKQVGVEVSLGGGGTVPAGARMKMGWPPRPNSIRDWERQYREARTATIASAKEEIGRSAKRTEQSTPIPNEGEVVEMGVLALPGPGETFGAREKLGGEE
jgi:transposase-like protein